MVNVRLLKPWLFNQVGRVILVGAGVADVLVRNRTAEVVTAATPKRGKGK